MLFPILSSHFIFNASFQKLASLPFTIPYNHGFFCTIEDVSYMQ